MKRAESCRITAISSDEWIHASTIARVGGNRKCSPSINLFLCSMDSSEKVFCGNERNSVIDYGIRIIEDSSS